MDIETKNDNRTCRTGQYLPTRVAVCPTFINSPAISRQYQLRKSARAPKLEAQVIPFKVLEVAHRSAANVMNGNGNAGRNFGLFPSESEIAKRLSQNPQDWPAKAAVLERYGLPRIDPLMGGRYWPAVEAYWQRRYGLSSIDVHQPDGKENFDAL